MDESMDLANKSLSRCLDSVNKIGYMDGATDGQIAAFQTSFDLAYEQGFSVGFKLGVNDATKSSPACYEKSVNCQLCKGSTTLQLDVGSIQEVQIEKNRSYLSQLNIHI